jgi:ectoine hydroxylase-related dioxygenase (phytanoyl-CoA dioxygenase family)
MVVSAAKRARIEVAPEAVAAYRRDGAVLIRNVLSAEELELPDAGREVGRASPRGMFTGVEAAAGRGETMVDQLPGLRSPSLRRFLEEGPSAELAARLMGAASAQLVLDQVFYKEKGRIVPTPWHQDTPFLRVRGRDMARVWLSCDPSPRDVTLQAVRGSHLWNVVYDTATMASSDVVTAAEGGEFTYSGIGDDRLPLLPDIEAHRDSFDILSWDVEPGDAIVFHGHMLHGASGKADHPRPRRAYASMWGGPQLRYHGTQPHAMPLPGDPAGARPVPQGAPIGEHPDVFPLFWRE